MKWKHFYEIKTQKLKNYYITTLAEKLTKYKLQNRAKWNLSTIFELKTSEGFNNTLTMVEDSEAEDYPTSKFSKQEEKKTKEKWTKFKGSVKQFQKI